MSAIIVNKQELLRSVGKKLGDKELSNALSMMGAPVDAVLETELEVDISPNRPDWLSEQGLARSLSSFIGVKTGLRQYKVAKERYHVIVDKAVSQVRPFTVCAVVKGLKFDDEKIREIIQIQEKLHATYCRNRKKAAIGIYPLEKIQFPITYTAKKPQDIVFVPLESSREMNASQLLVQHPTGRAYAHLLEGQPKFPVFIDAKGQVLSVPPIINSQTTGKVEVSTRDVFIECSGFDLRVLKTLLNIIVTALGDMGGRIVSVDVMYKKKITTPDLSPKKMKVDFGAVNRLLGLDLNEADIKKLLERMGYGYSARTVLVPAYRADVMHPVDLAEDIAIAYGYDKFRPEIPCVATIGSEDAFIRFQNVVADFLVGLGLLEASTYHLTNVAVQTKAMNCKAEVIELANALTVDYNALRAWMLPSLLEVLKVNKMKDYPQKFFTIGTVFSPNPKTPAMVEEKTVLGIVSAHPKADYTEIRQIVECLFRVLGLTVAFEETEHGSFVPGRVAQIKLDNHAIATIGEIHPQVITNFGLEMPVAAAEIDLAELFNHMKKA
ncbi:MAG: phenylalanine--tRNA ligase subunit beta [Candidatus Woesearchaeota archaeon]